METQTLVIDYDDIAIEELIKYHKSDDKRYRKLKSNAQFRRDVDTVITIPRAVTNTSQLSNFRKLNYEPLQYDLLGCSSVKIGYTSKYRLIFEEFDGGSTSNSLRSTNTMATNKNTTVPFRPVHPTEIIRDEIKARAMTQKELAQRMGMQAPNLMRLLKGENITTSIARKRESALSIPADFWMRLQAQYDRGAKAVAARTKPSRQPSPSKVSFPSR